MRETKEVLEKFSELRERYLKDRKIQYLGRLPINCIHNTRLRVRGKGQVGFCQNSIILAKFGGPQKMFACNDENTSCRCKLFQCKNTESDVERDFDEILKSPSRCGNEYPKLAMLIWFLQEDRHIEKKGRFLRAVDAFGKFFSICFLGR
jgi:hypothetical protein